VATASSSACRVSGFSNSCGEWEAFCHGRNLEKRTATAWVGRPPIKEERPRGKRREENKKKIIKGTKRKKKVLNSELDHAPESQLRSGEVVGGKNHWKITLEGWVVCPKRERDLALMGGAIKINVDGIHGPYYQSRRPSKEGRGAKFTIRGRYRNAKDATIVAKGGGRGGGEVGNVLEILLRRA